MTRKRRRVIRCLTIVALAAGVSLSSAIAKAGVQARLVATGPYRNRAVAGSRVPHGHTVRRDRPARRDLRREPPD